MMLRSADRSLRNSETRRLHAIRKVEGGFVSKDEWRELHVPVDALLQTARGIAQEIAAKSPLAVRAAKRSFNVTGNMQLRDAYRFEQSQTVALASSEETKEAQRAFAEKRKPSFKS